MPGEVEERSPEEEGDDVIRRNKTAIGLGGDVLAEMKVKQEKRASVIPKSSAEMSSSVTEPSQTKEREPENPFGGIKLR